MRLVNPFEIQQNVFHLLDDDWMLITAGTKDKFNTMTASWGGFGILWDMPVSFIFIRPQRYTFEFIEKNNEFSLSFFGGTFREALDFCGSHSGRDTDKIAATGLLPVETERRNIYFEQATLMFECRKIYFNDLDPANFLDKKIHKNYPAQNYHRLFIGEIINCMIKD